MSYTVEPRLKSWIPSVEYILLLLYGLYDTILRIISDSVGYTDSVDMVLKEICSTEYIRILYRRTISVTPITAYFLKIKT